MSTLSDETQDFLIADLPIFILAADSFDCFVRSEQQLMASPGKLLGPKHGHQTVLLEPSQRQDDAPSAPPPRAGNGIFAAETGG